MSKIISTGIAFAVISVMVFTVTSIWVNFDFPTMYGFWTIIVPAILGLSQIPVIGTFVSIIAWVVTFEMAMLFTKLVVWLAGLIQGQASQAPVH